MGEDQGRRAAHRLPETLIQSGDPVEGNPYPPEDSMHDVWREATREAEVELCRIRAEEASFTNAAKADEWLKGMAVNRFDLWAGRGVHVVWTDDDVEQFDRWLLEYANLLIDHTAELLDRCPPPIPAEGILRDLQRRLTARMHHWQGQARRNRIELEAQLAATTEQVYGRPGRRLLVRRRHAVQKYREDHGLDAVGFARTVGISETSVNGIVREDRTRFNHATQGKLLKTIGMTREEWYQE